MAEENRYEKTYLPVYRGAEPFTAKFSVFGDAELIAAYPEFTRPWKPDDLKDTKIYLPLGEGESIDDKLYRFKIEWDEESDEPLRIYDSKFLDASKTSGNWYGWPSFDVHAETPTLPREWRYRPIEKMKDNVVCFKFEFVPIKFQPLASTENGAANIAPVAEFLKPIAIHTVQMGILVNGKNVNRLDNGFTVHFSRDGEKWYGTRARMPSGLLPFETLFVQIATEKGVPIKRFLFDFEAVLETHGFRGTGESVVGYIHKRTDTPPQKVDCMQVFIDENDGLQMIIDNREDEPFRPNGGFASTVRERRNRLANGGGSHQSLHADGMHLGPTIPAKSLGVCPLNTFLCRGKSGHYYTYSVGFGPFVFSTTFSVPDTDHSGPNPPPSFFLGEDN